MKNIGIVGSRRRNSKEDYKIVEKKFFELYEAGDWIISGGCPKGGDSFAEKIGIAYGIPFLIFPADWERYGRGAGMIRNNDIAKTCDYLIACVADDRLGGTEDTIRKFLRDNLDTNLHLC